MIRKLKTAQLLDTDRGNVLAEVSLPAIMLNDLAAVVVSDPTFRLPRDMREAMWLEPMLDPVNAANSLTGAEPAESAKDSPGIFFTGTANSVRNMQNAVIKRIVSGGERALQRTSPLALQYAEFVSNPPFLHGKKWLDEVWIGETVDKVATLVPRAARLEAIAKESKGAAARRVSLSLLAREMSVAETEYALIPSSRYEPWTKGYASGASSSLAYASAVQKNASGDPLDITLTFQSKQMLADKPTSGVTLLLLIASRLAMLRGIETMADLGLIKNADSLGVENVTELRGDLLNRAQNRKCAAMATSYSLLPLLWYDALFTVLLRQPDLAFIWNMYLESTTMASKFNEATTHVAQFHLFPPMMANWFGALQPIEVADFPFGGSHTWPVYPLPRPIIELIGSVATAAGVETLTEKDWTRLRRSRRPAILTKYPAWENLGRSVLRWFWDNRLNLYTRLRGYDGSMSSDVVAGTFKETASRNGWVGPQLSRRLSPAAWQGLVYPTNGVVAAAMPTSIVDLASRSWISPFGERGMPAVLLRGKNADDVTLKMEENDRLGTYDARAGLRNAKFALPVNRYIDDFESVGALYDPLDFILAKDDDAESASFHILGGDPIQVLNTVNGWAQFLSTSEAEFKADVAQNAERWAHLLDKFVVGEDGKAEFVFSGGGKAYAMTSTHIAIKGRSVLCTFRPIVGTRVLLVDNARAVAAYDTMDDAFSRDTEMATLRYDVTPALVADVAALYPPPPGVKKTAIQPVSPGAKETKEAAVVAKVADVVRSAEAAMTETKAPAGV